MDYEIVYRIEPFPHFLWRTAHVNTPIQVDSHRCRLKNESRVSVAGDRDCGRADRSAPAREMNEAGFSLGDLNGGAGEFHTKTFVDLVAGSFLS